MSRFSSVRNQNANPRPCQVLAPLDVIFDLAPICSSVLEQVVAANRCYRRQRRVARGIGFRVARALNNADNYRQAPRDRFAAALSR